MNSEILGLSDVILKDLLEYRPFMKISPKNWLTGLPLIYVALSAFWFVLAASCTLGQNVEAAGSDQTLTAGPKDAKIKLVLFYDMQCPACATFHKKIGHIRSKFGNDVYISVKQFPLNIPAHDKSFMAARFVLAAELQGKGWQMLDAVLTNQKKWSSSSSARNLLIGYARHLGLNLSQFIYDSDSSMIEFAVINDIKLARSLHIDYTPCVIFNGEKISFAETDRIENKIEDLLKQRK